jgi:hypothetical protein
MPLEVWIALALVGVGLAAGGVSRLRRKRRTAPAAAENNIYPLW